VKRFLIPLAAFLLLAIFLALGLRHDPSKVPSPLIDKPAPLFRLPRLDPPPAGPATFSPTDLRGQVWVLNVWASWCVACRIEHPVLLDFARGGLAPLVGLDYKDQPTAARAWLAQHGNPYALTALDADGRVGIDYGVYGVPETYVIDKAGVIRYKQIGPVTPEVLRDEMVPLIKELQR
jgi:cytochrome c biogenesis protein CcmG, thiol:disulfide interchange protein DsbE